MHGDAKPWPWRVARLTGPNANMFNFDIEIERTHPRRVVAASLVLHLFAAVLLGSVIYGLLAGGDMPWWRLLAGMACFGVGRWLCPLDLSLHVDTK
jgi:hypothetical protein